MATSTLGLVASVEELAINDLGNSRAYETPKFTVGHIPQSPNPGSRGNGWYFGHLESPIQGEGNIFARLPLVPELLRKGEDVHVVIESGGREYLYVVSETDLIHQDDISLYQASDARVTLVTCFPRLKYDQRLLVTARLVGFRDLLV
jgi:sortase (surface protein transpeptidase)